jgi:hypothetical protein
MNSEVLRFLAFLCIIFIGVNNLFSIVLGEDYFNAAVDLSLLLIFFGVGYTIAVTEPED